MFSLFLLFILHASATDSPTENSFDAVHLPTDGLLSLASPRHARDLQLSPQRLSPRCRRALLFLAPASVGLSLVALARPSSAPTSGLAPLRRPPNVAPLFARLSRLARDARCRPLRVRREQGLQQLFPNSQRIQTLLEAARGRAMARLSAEGNTKPSRSFGSFLRLEEDDVLRRKLDELLLSALLGRSLTDETSVLAACETGAQAAELEALRRLDETLGGTSYSENDSLKRAAGNSETVFERKERALLFLKTGLVGVKGQAQQTVALGDFVKKWGEEWEQKIAEIAADERGGNRGREVEKALEIWVGGMVWRESRCHCVESAKEAVERAQNNKLPEERKLVMQTESKSF